MARGWESKSVEGQKESFESERRAAKERRTPAQIEHDSQIDSLLLTRKRVLNDLDRSRDPRHRKLLEISLAYLDSKIAELK